MRVWCAAGPPRATRPPGAAPRLLPACVRGRVQPRLPLASRPRCPSRLVRAAPHWRARALWGDGLAPHRPWSGRRKEGEEVWSDDDDTVDRLREAARQQCAASNKHLEARLRNVAQHFRVTPSAARETARALVLGGLRVQADTADSRPSSGGRGGSAGEGGSAMRPAHPPQSARGGQQAAPAPIAAA